MEQTTPTLTREKPEDVRLLSPADVARQAHVHPNTVRKLGEELRLVIIRTAGGNRLYTPDQAAAIAREIERRRRESYR
jgi:DNA-binding transcriptional MerR regulator